MISTGVNIRPKQNKWPVFFTSPKVRKDNERQCRDGEGRQALGLSTGGSGAGLRKRKRDGTTRAEWSASEDRTLCQRSTCGPGTCPVAALRPTSGEGGNESAWDFLYYLSNFPVSFK